MSKQNPAPKRVSVGGFEIGNDLPLALLAGPCQLESLDHAHMLAEKISATCADLGVPFVFKASYDKANRTSVSGKRGLGIEKGLEVLAAVREEFGCPVVTDVHDVEQVRRAGEVVDILQIPAFLCRQTDLLLAAGETGKVVNVKKGQFLAPWDMDHVAAKLASTGNEKIMLCERGTSFGYNALVSDMRSLPRMAETGYPVVFDATHSVQQPGGQGGSTGGTAAWCRFWRARQWPWALQRSSWRCMTIRTMRLRTGRICCALKICATPLNSLRPLIDLPSRSLPHELPQCGNQRVIGA